MTDYSELVKVLRGLANGTWKNCEYTWFAGEEKVFADAADAIEALQAQLPKRGEIVLCKECIHFTQGGWCDREFDWFPVDGNDFCSMAEKMEVQDGANR